MKKCNGPCGLEKEFDQFVKGTGSHGRASRCKECKKLYKPNSNEYSRTYYHANREKANEQRKKSYLIHREARIARCKEYDKTHQAEKAAREAFRRAQKLNATPPWLTDEHKQQIKSIYRLRDELTATSGIIYHVDHIDPLISDVLCGLHVPWNLQVITAEENLKKSNKVV
jgi:hypothetical protein